MLGNPTFYHGTIKKTTGAFGAIFNDMEITRTVGAKVQTVKVPLTYASADKAFERRNTDPTLNYNMQGIFPRASFYLTNISYDPLRKIQNTNYTAKNGQFVWAPAPYNLDYELYIATANIEDGLQIIEQILPIFNPEFTLSTDSVTDLDLKKDVPIILNSVSYVDPAQDSEFSDFRIIEWTLSFTAKTFIYGPKTNKSVIKTSTVNVFDDVPYIEDNRLETYSAAVTPSNANESDPHTITETIQIKG